MISIKAEMEEQERIERESYRQQCQEFFESLPPGDMARLAMFFDWVNEQAPETPADQPYVFRAEAS